MNDLSHLDDSGAPRMVDVSAKADTERRATASATVFTNAETLALATSGRAAKGDVFTTARLAGIMAAKRTAELIPLCHPLALTAIDVTLRPDKSAASIAIESSISSRGPTGVEMEALTAVSVAALTVYDMLKAADRSMRISDIRLLTKTGGSSGDYSAEGDAAAMASQPEPEPEAEGATPEESVIELASATDSESWQDGGPEEALAEAAAEAGWAVEAEPDSEQNAEPPATAPEDQPAADDPETVWEMPAAGASYRSAPNEEEVEDEPPELLSPPPTGVASEEEDELVVRPWSGVIPSVTTAERSTPEADPGLRGALTLQTGEVVTDLLEILKRVYSSQPALAVYDMAGVGADDHLRAAEIEAAAPLIPGFSPALIDALAQRDPQISSALERIPADASLASHVDEVPWHAVGELISAATGPGIGLSRATRILHKKRPALLPVIDESIMRYVLRIESKLPPEPADQMLRIMGILKQDLDANIDALTAAADEVDDVALTPLRVLDLTIRSLQ